MIPELDAEIEFAINLGLALGATPSELDRRLSSRDWAYYMAWWEKHGTFESLVVVKDKE